MHYKLQNTKDEDNQIKFLVWNVERVVNRMMEGDVEKQIVFIHVCLQRTCPIIKAEFPPLLGPSMLKFHDLKVRWFLCFSQF